MIKKILLIAVVIVVLFLVFRNVELKKTDVAVEDIVSTDVTAPAEEGEIRNVSVENSKIVWFGENKIQVKSHTGTLMFSEGSQLGFVSNEDETVSVSSGELVVDMQTLLGSENEPQALVDHLRSADFFDVEVYPEARFVVESYSANVVTGLLTIKETTEEVSIPYSVEMLPSGAYRVLGEVSLDRTVWGVTTLSGNFFDNVGDNIIEDTIVLSFDIQTN